MIFYAKKIKGKKQNYLKGEHQDTVYLNRLETPAYQAAAEKLIDKINQLSPKSLGMDSKLLVIKFKN